MSRKSLLMILSTSALIITSFITGALYERWQGSKNTLELDPSLPSLLARPSDFEFTDGILQTAAYTQAYYDPSITSVPDYKMALSSFTASFPTTDALLGFEHTIRRYVPGKMPETTQWDRLYQDLDANTEMEVRLLSLRELDENGRAFCTFEEESASINCHIELKYDQFISSFSIWSFNIEESQLIDNFITPAIQKFYDRLSKN